MKRTILGLLLAIITHQAISQSIENFDQVATGHLPAHWIAGVTGSGSPSWNVEADASAWSQSNVLKQSGAGDYPWCVINNVNIKNGFVEVKFKPLSGKEDQAAGVVWRWQDGGNYYVTRANALEDNVTIYYTMHGRRSAFENVNVKIASNVWHTLRVDFSDKSFKVSLDNKLAIDTTDATFSAAGAVGVWTKADSVTEFDDFTYGSTPQR